MQLNPQNWRSEEVGSSLLGVLGNHCGATGNTTVLILAKSLACLGMMKPGGVVGSGTHHSAEGMGTGTQEELFKQWKMRELKVSCFSSWQVLLSWINPPFSLCHFDHHNASFVL